MQKLPKNTRVSSSRRDILALDTKAAYIPPGPMRTVHAGRMPPRRRAHFVSSVPHERERGRCEPGLLPCTTTATKKQGGLSQMQRSALHIELVKKVFLTSSQTRPASLGSRLKGPHPAARIISTPSAQKFHTCRARSIFPDVHAAGENDFDFICAVRGANSARLFCSLNALPGVFNAQFFAILLRSNAESHRADGGLRRLLRASEAG